MSLNIDIPDRNNMVPKITVLGIGGAGGNAVNNMIKLKLQGVDFVAANTDAQALKNSSAETIIQLGEDLTKGLGAGSSPEIGSQAAIESNEDVVAKLSESNMVFITAGMGGGTGTGAAPEIARICKENGILTVGVVTKPFHFEGSYRMKTAEAGVAEMQKYVDTLIVIPNQNLFHKATEQTTFAEAFSMVDDILYSGIKGITDLMTMPGLINLDFADIRAIMGSMGKAMMGTGEASGEKRALEAAEAAISNPLLDNASMKGAKGVLINISGGLDMTLFEADEAAQRIKDEVDPDANIIFGSTFDQELDGQIRVSVVATGINMTGAALERNNLFNNFSAPRAGLESRINQEEAPSRIERSASAAAPAPAVPAPTPNNAAAQKKEYQPNLEKAFIPPSAVNPQSLQTNEKSEAAADIVAEEPQQAAPAEPAETAQLDTQNSPFAPPASKAEEPAEPAAEILAAEPEEQKIETAPLAQEKPAASADKKAPKLNKLGGLFGGFFKDQDDQEEQQEAPKADDPIVVKDEEEAKAAPDVKQAANDDEAKDLIFSDDIFNVPTFLRNKQGKVENE